jgi:hypothetical protein
MTTPEVFIIESLRFEDERNNRFVAKVVSDILNLNGHRSVYYYIRTKSEFASVIRLFEQSNYRFLHLSCLGNASSMFTTLDTVYFGELAGMLAPVLRQKRLFVSSTTMAHESLAKYLWPFSQCYSLVGPLKAMRPRDATAFWSTFYHLIPNYDWTTMRREGLLRYLDPISILFDVTLSYFYSNAKEKKGYRQTLVPKKAKPRTASAPATSALSL